jgi:haloacetate dehalogenase
VLVIWSASGALGSWYGDDSDAIALWREWSDDVRGRALDAGHFFPEEAPVLTAELLHRFMTTSAAAPR